MIKAIAIIIVVILAAILIYAATKPDTFLVERTANIKAPPEKIFALINDFHLWEAWTPYNKDPAMKKTYSGTQSGVGAIYEWDGNKEVGTGSVEITESSLPSKITIKLDMSKPLECHNIVQFTIKPNDASTDVTWSLHGPNSYTSKIMGLFINMDTMVGKDFETGLARLKSLAEK